MTEAVSAAAVPAPSRRLALGVGADGTYTRPGQAAAFVLGLVTTFVFLPLVVVAALLYTRAETRFADDPARARVLVRWSWLCITLFPILAAGAIGAVVAAIVALTG
ncbi:hypothetical protein [Actinomadura decatromicini]|uniref:Uncharacterized protein n=1 Tax=Actinomadura decatromicini TaxID=2604572 RepID=A0A5D3FW09_9ACTN|nr:hypothetical protein [Actinomadura decatromicini]TYK52294.1 hypothetical protein FXF68_00350 [Actinomadura decatromicini]